MSTSRLVFIPFNRLDCDDFIKETQNSHRVADSHHKRDFIEVCYDDPDDRIKGLGASLGTRLMIAGHGQAGRPYISNTSGAGRNKWYLPFNVVADRLIEHGLSKWYTGTISTDVCYSACSGKGNPAFADLFARYMHEKGYKLVNVMGYLGPMYAVPHRNAKLAGSAHKYSHRAVEMADGTVRKTKDANVRFFGTQGVPKALRGLAAAQNACPAW